MGRILPQKITAMTDTSADAGDQDDAEIERLEEELRDRRHAEYVDIRRSETGEIVVQNIPSESSHFNNAEFAAFYAAGLHPVHIECESEEVHLRAD